MPQIAVTLHQPLTLGAVHAGMRLHYMLTHIGLTVCHVAAVLAVIEPVVPVAKSMLPLRVALQAGFVFGLEVAATAVQDFGKTSADPLMLAEVYTHDIVIFIDFV